MFVLFGRLRVISVNNDGFLKVIMNKSYFFLLLIFGEYEESLYMVCLC